MAERILVVDDDRQLTSFLDRFLSKQGYAVSIAASAAQMGLMMEHAEFDLLVLDIGLPDLDGFEITREIRRTSRLPIVILTARDEVYDRIIGLEMGADDYVCKPFEPRELLARIKSVLRRALPVEDVPKAVQSAQTLTFAGYVLDLITQNLRDTDGLVVPLTSTEFTLLKILAERPGKVMTRAHILETLYGNATGVTDRAIDAHIARLRSKIETAEADALLIRTVHGVGYCLAASVEAV
jgi:DNA-binding response OmpR family regulator